MALIGDFLFISLLEFLPPSVQNLKLVTSWVYIVYRIDLFQESLLLEECQFKILALEHRPIEQQENAQAHVRQPREEKEQE